MSDQRDGGISWTDETWNPIRGCSRVSEGCRNCYAEKVAGRFSGPGLPYEGLVTIGEKGPRWNGTVRLVEKHLGDPLRWKRPRRVFVNSMSDLFHESLPFELVAAVFGVMAAAPQHTFQVLTKRPKRALEFFAWIAQEGAWLQESVGEKPPGGSPVPAACASYVGRAYTPERDVLEATTVPGWRAAMKASWPLPNVWLGVSVEDQAAADERIPLLLECPAAVRWVSYEPALGPVDFRHIFCPNEGFGARGIDSLAGEAWWYADEATASAFCRPADGLAESIRSSFGPDGWFDGPAAGPLDWIVVGGESGPGARPFDLAWARGVVKQCRETGTACFVKQLGSWAYAKTRDEAGRYQRRSQVLGAARNDFSATDLTAPNVVVRLLLEDTKGGDMAEWPEDLRVREWPEVRG